MAEQISGRTKGIFPVATAVTVLTAAPLAIAAAPEVAAAAATAGEATSTVSTVIPRVLGHFPAYLQVGEALAAKTFSIPPAIFATMTKAQQWAANVKFLDRGIKQGAEFIMATLRADIRSGSVLEKEVNYLLQNGYRWSENGMSLIPK